MKQPGELMESTRWLDLYRPQSLEDIGALVVYPANAANVNGWAINVAQRQGVTFPGRQRFRTP